MQNQELILGFPFIKIYTSNICEGCIMGKYSISHFPKQGFTWASSLLDLIHSDVCGPIQTHSFNRVYYFVVFIVDFFQFTKVCFMWSKSNVFSIFQFYKTFVKTQIGRKNKNFHLNNGGEYISLKFNKFCDECNIQRQFFISYIARQMGLLNKKIAHWWNLLEVCSH
jgi:hypothetical protein